MSRAERRRRAQQLARVLQQLPPPPARRWPLLRWRWLIALAAGFVADELVRRWL